MDIQLFDNYEEDGQLSMFDMGEDLETLSNRTDDSAVTEENRNKSGHVSMRIQKCSTCGKLLFVTRKDDAYVAFCNACGISYQQKI